MNIVPSITTTHRKSQIVILVQIQNSHFDPKLFET